MNSRKIILALLFLTAISSSIQALAQSEPTAIRPLQISVFGAAAGVYTGLEGGKNFLITLGGDLALPPTHGMRPTVEVRGSYPINGGNISSERSVLGGLKLEFLPTHRLRPYGDFLFGRGQMNYTANYGLNGFPFGYYVYTLTTTNVESPGFGFDYQFSPHLALKLDGQYQRWASVPTDSGLIYSKVGSVGLIYYFTFDGPHPR
jgi:hypothetical protein